jgi:hypothetical protein
MKKAVSHLRANAIAYLALFVALGGTSYAAISIPRNSVGTRQLRNGAVTGRKLGKGSVTPATLDGRSIAGYVAFWARVDQSGQVLASSVPATTTNWASGAGYITFHRVLSTDCFPLANIAPPQLGVGYVSSNSQSSDGSTNVFITMANPADQPAPEPVDVAEICP